MTTAETREIADMTDAEVLRRIIAETEAPLLRRIAELEAKLVDAERAIYRSGANSCQKNDAPSAGKIHTGTT